MAESYTLHKLCVEKASRGPLLLLFLFLSLLSGAILASNTVIIRLNLAHLFALEVVPLIPQPLSPFNIFEEVVPRLWQYGGIVWIGVGARIHAAGVDLGGQEVALVELNETI